MQVLRSARRALRRSARAIRSRRTTSRSTACACTTSTRARAAAAPVLLLHGEPSWSYLYRKMIPIARRCGHRCVAPGPDRLRALGQAGRARAHYTYQRHVDWMRGVLDGARPARRHARVPGLGRARSACAWSPSIRTRFARVVAANTFLPTGDRRARPGVRRAGASTRRRRPSSTSAASCSGGCATAAGAEVIAAYDAPFPDDSLQGRRAAVPDAGAGHAGRSAAPANRARVGGAAALDEAVPDRVQRRRIRSRAGGDAQLPARDPGALANRTPPSPAPATSSRKTRRGARARGGDFLASMVTDECGRESLTVPAPCGSVIVRSLSI